MAVAFVVVVIVVVVIVVVVVIAAVVAMIVASVVIVAVGPRRKPPGQPVDLRSRDKPGRAQRVLKGLPPAQPVVPGFPRTGCAGIPAGMLISRLAGPSR